MHMKKRINLSICKILKTECGLKPKLRFHGVILIKIIKSMYIINFSLSYFYFSTKFSGAIKLYIHFSPFLSTK